MYAWRLVTIYDTASSKCILRPKCYEAPLIHLLRGIGATANGEIRYILRLCFLNPTSTVYTKNHQKTITVIIWPPSFQPPRNSKLASLESRLNNDPRRQHPASCQHRPLHTFREDSSPTCPPGLVNFHEYRKGQDKKQGRTQTKSKKKNNILWPICQDLSTNVEDIPGLYQHVPTTNEPSN